MPSYKLSYFNITGLAETARFLLAYGGIDYEDNRIEKDDWPAVKSTFPLGQVPVLEVDGTQINQSLAIARYLGKIVKLAGNNDLEDALIDAAALNVNDFRLKLSVLFYEQDEVIKKQKLDEIKNEIIPAFSTQLEKVFASNSGYLALGRLTWADLYFAALTDMFSKIGVNFPKSGPVEEYLTKIRSIPSIKKWIEIRPADPTW